jgi:hypothetical protein
MIRLLLAGTPAFGETRTGASSGLRSFGRVLEQLYSNLDRERAKLMQQEELLNRACDRSGTAGGFARFARQDQAELDAARAKLEQAQTNYRSLQSEIGTFSSEYQTKQTALRQVQQNRQQSHEVFLQTQDDYANAVDLLQRGIAYVESAPGPLSAQSLLSLRKMIAPLAMKVTPQLETPQVPFPQQPVAFQQALPDPSGSVRVADNFLSAQTQFAAQSNDMDVAPEQVQQPLEATGLQMVAPPSFVQTRMKTRGAIASRANEQVVSVLKELLETFRTDRQTSVDKENRDQNTFTQLQKSLNSMVTTLIQRVQEKQSEQQAYEAGAAEAQVAAESAQGLVGSTKQLAGDMEETCQYQVRSLTHQKEVLDDALQRIKSGDALMQNAEVAVPQNIPALIQLDSTTRQAAKKVLLETGYRTMSPTLIQTAARIGTAPNNEVSTMLQSLLGRLSSAGETGMQQSSRAQQQAWCQQQLSSTSDTESVEKSRVTSFKDRQQRMEAAESTISAAVDALNERIGGLDKAVNAAKEERRSETQIVAVEQKSHGVAGKALSAELQLLQQMPRESHVGSLIQILQRALADIQELQLSSRASEQQLETLFQRFEADVTSTSNSLQTALGGSRARLAEIKQAKLQTLKDLADAKQEVESSDQYMVTLRPSCEFIDKSMNEGSKNRNDEINAVQQAVQVLDASNLPAVNQAQMPIGLHGGNTALQYPAPVNQQFNFQQPQPQTQAQLLPSLSMLNSMQSGNGAGIPIAPMDGLTMVQPM